MRAHWRHIVNTTERPLCCGDAALCQITLIICTCCALLQTNRVWACLTGCETWTKQRGVASLYGMLYPFTTLTDCLNLCLEMYPCVAVDVSSDVCVVHTNINDTANTFNSSGFTQYTLNRACLSSTPTLPLSSASFAQSTSGSTSVGNF